MKKLTVLFLVLVCALSLGACNKQYEERPVVSEAAAAKYEYYEDLGKYKLITSEIAMLYTFDDLELMKTDEYFSDEWIYRLTFNPNEMTENADEIIILFRSDSLSINGVNYVAADGVDFSSILEWADSKYQYFDYEPVH